MTDSLMMSDSLRDLVDEDSLMGDVPKVEKPTFLVMFSKTHVETDLVRGEWDTKGRIQKMIFRMAASDIQKVLEGIKVASMGFRPTQDAKTTWVNLEDMEGVEHTLDVIDGVVFLTVTVHYSLDT